MNRTQVLNITGITGGSRKGLAQARADGGSGGGSQIAVDYLPPMTADMSIKVPYQHDANHAVQLSASGLNPDMDLPDNFSWNDQESVRQYRMGDYDVSWLMTPPNQAHCGSCWAVSSASAFTDRHSIAMKMKCPILSATVTTTCAPNEAGHDGCQGGLPSDAGLFYEAIGIPTDECVPYASWCPPDGTQDCSVPACCSTGSSMPLFQAHLDNPEGDRPPCFKDTTADGSNTCADYGKRFATSQCTSPNPSSDSSVGNPYCCSSGCTPAMHQIYKAIPQTTRSLGSGDPETIFHRMKWNVFAGGPIVATYFVFMDFMVPTVVADWGWKMTNGIYINEPNNSPYAQDPYILSLPQKIAAGDPVAINLGSKFLGLSADDVNTPPDEIKSRVAKALQKLDGGHAVTVVGWGVGDTKHPKYGTVRYWIVRNSWGDQWNEKGYFKIAFTDMSKNINTAVGFDYPTGQLLGGATVFQVPSSSKTDPNNYHPLSGKDKKDKNGKNGDAASPGDPGSEKKKWWMWLIVAFMALLCLVVVFLVYALIKKSKVPATGSRSRISSQSGQAVHPGLQVLNGNQFVPISQDSL